MHGGAIGTEHLLLAETLGLAMARRASDILERHRATLTSGSAASGTADDDDDQFAVDNAIFTAVLDAANECLGRFDSRPADDRWCDALLQVIHLAQLARLSADGLPPPYSPFSALSCWPTLSFFGATYRSSRGRPESRGPGFPCVA